MLSTQVSTNLEVIDMNIEAPTTTLGERVRELLVCLTQNPMLRVS